MNCYLMFLQLGIAVARWHKKTARFTGSEGGTSILTRTSRRRRVYDRRSCRRLIGTKVDDMRIRRMSRAKCVTLSDNTL
ncbi:hypothetical protein EDD16DRAFT_1627906 [Pisolithus croceorrhizus]|nr:hypothetical protein EDD16DRAFT_1627906 [Pisolithus croceorrhizus]